MQARMEMAEGREPVDWGCSEMFALGVCCQGIPVRLTGQDVERNIQPSTCGME